MEKITLVNVNLMFSNLNDNIDYQAYFPIGIMQIAAVLEKEGYKIDIRDYQLFIKDHFNDPFNIDRFMSFINNCGEVIGLSCMANLLPFVILASKKIKEIYPDKTIILGGVGPTGVPLEIMQNFGWIDYICVGEGERSIVKLLELIKKNGKHINEAVEGCYVRIDGKPVFKCPKRIEDLDSLPFPSYNLINKKDYDAAFSIVTSRGCPYKCTFCTETNHWENKVVFRSVENVIDELKIIKKISHKNVFLFQDDQITLDRDRAVYLFKKIIDENIDMQWKAFVRVNLVDEELLKLMVKSGCVQVRFGVESGSNNVLKKIRKQFTIEEAIDKIRLSLKHVLSVHAAFIWGFPFETLDECIESIRWVYQLQKENCTTLFFLLSPLPNSEIFMNYKGSLDFNEELQANFNSSGAEKSTVKGNYIDENNKYMFDFIKKYPRIFPGFYLYDYKNNILPKKKLIYNTDSAKLIFRTKRDIKNKGYDLVDL
jgi:anaerobic magnesium-protoporphyrin IX monomethyl ester cyclase